ncbi:MAG: ABC transporter ATP-binding protein [Anaerolineaceae bacterium]|nr:ABC transporter ATP-binding protein [Anaerolineaceae bacterium]MDD4043230.1 ABC transporter ATP-binding protein [Anaerolineaceae bacterium]
MHIVSDLAEKTETDTNGAIVRLENVSVSYRLPSERIGTFKEYAIRKIQRKIKIQDFWALTDFSLQINEGEVFGIIGNNGAGKSTLLKVISRVLKPTRGRVVVYGRIAPLLELGAGFHPELSGRENVFLNGALLGYSQAEMEAVFDEIVEFSELKQFINSPIRTYSSGMYARLGFAVATAHVPDILILDEILSVGDEAFQKKSRDRLQSFQQQGATVLLVSHALDSMIGMCDRIVWIDHGKVRKIGVPEEVIAEYREDNI